jgi:hypothetical protein
MNVSILGLTKAKEDDVVAAIIITAQSATISIKIEKRWYCAFFSLYGVR